MGDVYLSEKYTWYFDGEEGGSESRNTDYDNRRVAMREMKLKIAEFVMRDDKGVAEFVIYPKDGWSEEHIIAFFTIDTRNTITRKG